MFGRVQFSGELLRRQHRAWTVLRQKICLDGRRPAPGGPPMGRRDRSLFHRPTGHRFQPHRFRQRRHREKRSVSCGRGRGKLSAVDQRSVHRAVSETVARRGMDHFYLVPRRPPVHSTACGRTEANARCCVRFDGLNSAAAWMPDGKSIVATLSDGRSPNLYQVDLEGNILHTLDQFPGGGHRAHGVPRRAPDRVHLGPPGTPQIYLMDATGAKIRRATTGPLADSPHWSPLGHLVVFTQLEKKLFRSVDVGSGHRPTVPADVRRRRQRKRLVVPGWAPHRFFQHPGRPAGAVGDGRGRIFPAALGRVSRTKFYPPLGILIKGPFMNAKTFFPWRTLTADEIADLLARRGAAQKNAARRPGVWRAKVWA
jgi:hypothetical protein